MPAGILSQQPMTGVLGSGLTLGGQGLAPYGIRHSGLAPKGLGFFGLIPNRQGGYSTEISTEFDVDGKSIEAPMLVPTLNRQEIERLLGGGQPTDEIYRKAQEHALQRIGQGLSPFAGPSDLRIPLPAPSMGAVNGLLSPALGSRPALSPMIGVRG